MLGRERRIQQEVPVKSVIPRVEKTEEQEASGDKNEYEARSETESAEVHRALRARNGDDGPRKKGNDI